MMETPLSTRRITRSQTRATTTVLSSISSRNHEEPEKGSSKKPRNQRTSLIDITNGSPIVGLAISKNSTRTPISSTNNHKNTTPCSGEALLRGQVKNLLSQNVEQVFEISKFLSFDTVCERSNGVFAPTPMNTPHIFNFNSGVGVFGSIRSVLESTFEEHLTVSEPEAVSESECEKDVISRSLFMDFSDKSDCSSVLTFECSEEGIEKGIREKSSMKDDDASTWSIQVNASPRDKLFGEEGEAESDESEIDELSLGMENVEIEYPGKHTRFVYDRDDEVVMEEEVWHLKGLPTPKGKHLRFQDDE